MSCRGAAVDLILRVLGTKLQAGHTRSPWVIFSLNARDSVCADLAIERARQLWAHAAAVHTRLARLLVRIVVVFVLREALLRPLQAPCVLCRSVERRRPNTVSSTLSARVRPRCAVGAPGRLRRSIAATRFAFAQEI